jgi:prepilin-type N-terminal cleavage/methylation domain-containing protein
MLKKIFSNKKTKGFTLVELLIVIAIIAIISAISWSTLGGGKKQSSVNNTCEQIASMINKTRNYALSGNVGTTSANPAKFFTIHIGKSDSTIAFTNGSKEIPLEANVPHLGGVTCEEVQMNYFVPDATLSIGYADGRGVSVISNDIKCQSDGNIRTIKVTPFTAVCE